MCKQAWEGEPGIIDNRGSEEEREKSAGKAGDGDTGDRLIPCSADQKRADPFASGSQAVATLSAII